MADMLDVGKNFEEPLLNLSDAEWDAKLIEAYLRPPSDPDIFVPLSADEDYEYAHENPDAWRYVKVPSGMSKELALQQMTLDAEVQDARPAAPRHLPGKHDQSTHGGKGGKGKLKLADKPHYTGSVPTRPGAPDPVTGNYPGYQGYLDKTFDSYESIYTVPDATEVPEVLLKYLPRGPVLSDEGAIADAQFGAAIKQAERSKRVRISASEARGNSRAVSEKEYDKIADDGERMLGARMRNRAPAKGLDDNWDGLKEDTYSEVQKPWGGATINARTGKPLASNADEYALSIKTKGQETVSIPEKASRQQFDQAMDQAKERYSSQLEYEGSHLGVFHDDENARIDIDPVIVVKNLAEVEAIGAATHAIGGAYHFASGDGFWPPHVAAEGGRMRKIGLGEEVHWFGPGDWHTYAEAVQKPIRDQYME